MAKTCTVASKQATNDEPKVEVVSDDGVKQLSLRIPIADPQEGTYIAIQSGHVDAHLGHGGVATMAFRRLHAGLLASRATFGDGRPVVTKADVIRWLFLRIASEESAASA